MFVLRVFSVLRTGDGALYRLGVPLNRQKSREIWTRGRDISICSALRCVTRVAGSKRLMYTVGVAPQGGQ
jgi:hypothetical protein